jgi:hypothetical protein
MAHLSVHLDGAVVIPMQGLGKTPARRGRRMTCPALRWWGLREAARLAEFDGEASNLAMLYTRQDGWRFKGRGS